jgi:predicted lipoprotein
VTTYFTRREALFGLAALGIGIAGASVVAACKDDDKTTPPPDRAKILADVTSLVIVPTYVDAANQAKSLETALGALRDFASVDSLAHARDAWKTARRAWKVTDAFVFGPADDLSVTGGIIDDAADFAKIEALAQDTAPLDANAVNRLGANMRGFPAIEALLFDPAKDDAAMLAAFQAPGDRRGTFAALLGADLRAKIDAVAAAWNGPPIDYANQLAKAGRGSAVYAAERQGFDAVVNALIAAAEVIISIHLAKPLGIDKTPAVPAPELVESPRSDVSVDDIVAVLDGIDAVYFGRHAGVGGLAISAAVAAANAPGDAKMRDSLPKAKDAMRAISGPLRTAVVDRRDSVVAAHDAIREVKRCLATDVAGALGTSVGFNVTDGD